jgi:hypothetical protein
VRRGWGCVGIEFTGFGLEEHADVGAEAGVAGECELYVCEGEAAETVCGQMALDRKQDSENDVLMAGRGAGVFYEVPVKELPATAFFVRERVEAGTGHPAH